MKRERLALAVALSTLVLPAAASAQEARRLKIGIAAEVAHDSNVARTSAAQAVLRGLTLEDTVFTPSVTVDFLAPVGRQSIFLSGTAGYAFYDKNDKLDSERLDFTGGANLGLGPCAVALSGGYARGLSQIDDRTLITVAENLVETKRANIDIGCSRPTGFGVVAQASTGRTTNDLAIMKPSDFDVTTYMVGLSYQRPALGTVTVFANREETEYFNRTLEAGFTMNSVGVTLSRQLGARIQGSVTVAYAQIKQEGVLAGLTSAGDVETTTFAGSLSFRASDRLRLQAAFNRGATPSEGLGRTYDLSESYEVGGEYDFGSRVTLGLGYASVDRDSKGVLPVPDLLADAKTTNLYASIRYKQSERLSFLLRAEREEQITNAPQFDYTSERIGLSANVTF